MSCRRSSALWTLGRRWPVGQRRARRCLGGGGCAWPRFGRRACSWCYGSPGCEALICPRTQERTEEAQQLAQLSRPLPHHARLLRLWKLLPSLPSGWPSSKVCSQMHSSPPGWCCSPSHLSWESFHFSREAACCQQHDTQHHIPISAHQWVSGSRLFQKTFCALASAHRHKIDLVLWATWLPRRAPAASPALRAPLVPKLWACSATNAGAASSRTRWPRSEDLTRSQSKSRFGKLRLWICFRPRFRFEWSLRGVYHPLPSSLLNNCNLIHSSSHQSLRSLGLGGWFGIQYLWLSCMISTGICRTYWSFGHIGSGEFCPLRSVSMDMCWLFSRLRLQNRFASEQVPLPIPSSQRHHPKRWPASHLPVHSQAWPSITRQPYHACCTHQLRWHWASHSMLQSPVSWLQLQSHGTLHSPLSRKACSTTWRCLEVPLHACYFFAFALQLSIWWIYLSIHLFWHRWQNILRTQLGRQRMPFQLSASIRTAKLELQLTWRRRKFWWILSQVGRRISLRFQLCLLWMF